MEQKRKDKKVLCPSCGEPKTRYSAVCRECFLKKVKNVSGKRDAQRRWYELHRNTILEDRHLARTEYKKTLKGRVLKHYGNGQLSCVRCGFDDIRALTIDHIDSKINYEGTAKAGGSSLYKWLRGHNYPEGFQTLCMNCQWLKRDEEGEAPYLTKKSQKGGLGVVHNRGKVV